MTPRTTGRVVGALFILAILAYGSGSALVVAAAGDPVVLSDVAAGEMQLSVGSLLMLVNSLVVVGIGLLVFPILKAHDRLTAYAYLVARVIEGVLLAVGVLCLLLLLPIAAEYVDAAPADQAGLTSLARVLQEGSHYAYQIGMLSLGLGAVLFCRVLLRAGLVPRLLALWGIAGYAVFALGSVLELLGYGVGVALSIPGGLFELALGVLLIVRGFPSARPAVEQREPSLA